MEIVVPECDALVSESRKVDGLIAIAEQPCKRSKAEEPSTKGQGMEGEKAATTDSSAASPMVALSISGVNEVGSLLLSISPP